MKFISFNPVSNGGGVRLSVYMMNHDTGDKLPVATSPAVQDWPTEDMWVHADYTNNYLMCGCRLPVALIKDGFEWPVSYCGCIGACVNMPLEK